MEQQAWWGLYHYGHGVWRMDNTATVIHYPSFHIAEAHREVLNAGGIEGWQVREFGA